MSFDTRAGTRGGWQPGTGGAVGRWLTKRAVNRIRRTGTMMGLGFDALVLTTIGRKTGAERRTPVGRFPGKDGSWLIVASAAGAPRNPAWYYNIAANPDKVQIEMAGRKIAVAAEQLHGEYREEAWLAAVVHGCLGSAARLVCQRLVAPGCRGIRLQARVSRLARGTAAHEHIFTTPAIGHTRSVWRSSAWEPLACAQLRASVSQAVGAVAFSMILPGD